MGPMSKEVLEDQELKAQEIHWGRIGLAGILTITGIALWNSVSDDMEVASKVILGFLSLGFAFQLLKDSNLRFPKIRS